MLIPVLLFLLGLLLLIKGGDWFVDGAAGAARQFRVPELLIGATVVSIGTTLPEAMVSATSAVEGFGEIAYGNAIGSIICNTALVAALTVTLRPGPADTKTLRTPVAFFFAAAALYAGLAYSAGSFSRIAGIALLGLFAVYMLVVVMQVRQVSPSPEAAEGLPLGRALGLLALGAALIALGAHLLVDNGIRLAGALGVPQSVIALTFVALGTSLPELVTAAAALAKGHSALSLGNIIGANFFNLTLVSGLSVTLSPFSIPRGSELFGRSASLVLDIPLMLLAMALLTLPTLARGKLSRLQGILLLAAYAAFCAVQFCL